MSLTYDQKSEIRMAFDEAFVPADRRREVRIKHDVDAQISPWRQNRQGTPFPVRIEDFSPSGVGLHQLLPMTTGDEYLIKVPRPNLPELVVLLKVARCVPAETGGFHIGMELSSVMGRSEMGQFVDAINQTRRVTTRRTRVLLILFGIFGIGTSLLIR
ncbi:MAG: PilZ domain-containing protein [Tepidisphaeraceae bacterium]